MRSDVGLIMAVVLAAACLVGIYLIQQARQTDRQQFEQELAEQRELLFQIVLRDSPKHLVEAAQAELCRIQLYRGPVDGKCGPATLEAEVKYLVSVIEGETFNSFEVR